MFSRIAHTFNLPDYQPLDLARIFEKFLKQHGWQAMVSTEDIAGVFALVPQRLLEQTNGMNARFSLVAQRSYQLTNLWVIIQRDLSVIYFYRHKSGKLSAGALGGA
jgi:hypothetical protein